MSFATDDAPARQEAVCQPKPAGKIFETDTSRVVAKRAARRAGNRDDETAVETTWETGNSTTFVAVIGVEILDLRDSWKWHTGRWLKGKGGGSGSG